jgi:hypothetical protein
VRPIPARWNAPACRCSSRWWIPALYFNYHHTPADTLDKVNPLELKRHVAVMTSLTWYLANMEENIGRAAPQQD